MSKAPASNIISRPSEWPSLEQQLAAAKVIHGSALETLIRENQDFTMLRPDEAHDRLNLPPWLRVYWRKHHPEATYSAADPSGGYPRVLLRIYSWMLHNQHTPLTGQPGAAPLVPQGRRQAPGGHHAQ